MELSTNEKEEFCSLYNTNKIQLFDFIYSRIEGCSEDEKKIIERMKAIMDNYDDVDEPFGLVHESVSEIEYDELLQLFCESADVDISLSERSNTLSIIECGDMVTFQLANGVSGVAIVREIDEYAFYVDVDPDFCDIMRTDDNTLGVLDKDELIAIKDVTKEMENDSNFDVLSEYISFNIKKAVRSLKEKDQNKGSKKVFNDFNEFDDFSDFI